MVTIFSTTRAFTGIYGLIQRNALRSWTLLEPRPEIILFGDDPGTKEICAELGLIHVPDVATTEFGTPLVSDMFSRGQSMASNDLCCFMNSDIVLFQEFIDALRRVHDTYPSFLMVGRRWDLDVTRPLAFEPGWDERLKEQARSRDHRRTEIFIDYFAFPTGTYPELPPFAIGRTAYDNWLIWKANSLDVPVVDATENVMVVHQNHDYSHGGGGKQVWEGPEAQRARTMIGHWTRYHSIDHARFMITADGRVTDAVGRNYRLARPKRYASHLLRFTRPMRRRVTFAKMALRKRVREGGDVRAPRWVNGLVVRIAQLLARPPLLGRAPGRTYEQIGVKRGRTARLGLWLAGRQIVIDRPLVLPWWKGSRIESWLGNDMNRSLYVDGAFEPNEVTFVASILDAGSVFVDVGANEGPFTVMASAAVAPTGTAVAVEPSPRERALLERNLSLNHSSNVTVVPVALGEAAGEAVLHLADGRRAGMNTFGEYAHPGVRSGGDITVPVRPLDDVVGELGLSRIDVIKIDVEGAERSVLCGGRGTLARFRPVLLLELNEASLTAQGSSVAEVCGLLEDSGYAMAPFSEVTGIPVVGAVHAGDLNCAAIPTEKVGELVRRDVVQVAREGESRRMS